MTAPDSPQSYAGATAFERKLTRIVDSSDTEDEEQSKLLMLLVREVHTVKWLLWTALIIVPAIAIILGIVLAHSYQPAVTTGP